MRQVFRVGQDIDVLSGEEYAAGIKLLSQELHGVFDALAPPTIQRKSNSGVTDAAGALTLEVTKVPGRFMWDLRAYRVMGPSEATITGVCFVYRNEVAPSNYLDHTTTIPDVSNAFGTHGATLMGGESFVAHITGAPAATRIAVNVQFIQEIAQTIEQATRTEEI